MFDTTLDKVRKITKLVLAVASITCFIIGFAIKKTSWDWSGLISLILFYIFCLIETGYAGALYERKSIFKKFKDFALTNVFIAIIVLFGFFLGLAKINMVYTLIWISTVVHYALNGVVFSLTTGIPVRMTYGGWRIPKRRH